MAIYAVGDLQGCLSPLKRLLDEVHFEPGKDCLWLTGDLVNRGPDSLGCLRFVKQLGNSAVTVLGNHDLHLLAVYYGGQASKRKDTLDRTLKATDAEELMEWLKRQPLLHLDETHNRAMVHAGIPHIWSIKKARKYAEELESALREKKVKTLFQELYGDKPEALNSGLKGTTRLRVIANYFTRMRFISEKGALELKTKTAPADAPKGYRPWYQFKREDNTQIIFGHWAALMGKTGFEQFVGLDTGCVWGNYLSLKNLDNGKIYKAGLT